MNRHFHDDEDSFEEPDLSISDWKKQFGHSSTNKSSHESTDRLSNNSSMTNQEPLAQETDEEEISVSNLLMKKFRNESQRLAEEIMQGKAVVPNILEMKSPEIDRIVEHSNNHQNLLPSVDTWLSVEKRAAEIRAKVKQSQRAKTDRAGGQERVSKSSITTKDPRVIMELRHQRITEKRQERLQAKFEQQQKHDEDAEDPALQSSPGKRRNYHHLHSVHKKGPKFRPTPTTIKSRNTNLNTKTNASMMERLDEDEMKLQLALVTEKRKQLEAEAQAEAEAREAQSRLVTQLCDAQSQCLRQALAKFTRDQARTRIRRNFGAWKHHMRSMQTLAQTRVTLRRRIFSRWCTRTLEQKHLGKRAAMAQRWKLLRWCWREWTIYCHDMQSNRALAQEERMRKQGVKASQFHTQQVLAKIWFNWILWLENHKDIRASRALREKRRQQLDHRLCHVKEEEKKQEKQEDGIHGQSQHDRKSRHDAKWPESPQKKTCPSSKTATTRQQPRKAEAKACRRRRTTIIHHQDSFFKDSSDDLNIQTRDTMTMIQRHTYDDDDAQVKHLPHEEIKPVMKTQQRPYSTTTNHHHQSHPPASSHPSPFRGMNVRHEERQARRAALRAKYDLKGELAQARAVEAISAAEAEAESQAYARRQAKRQAKRQALVQAQARLARRALDGEKWILAQRHYARSLVRGLGLDPWLELLKRRRLLECKAELFAQDKIRLLIFRQWHTTTQERRAMRLIHAQSRDAQVKLRYRRTLVRRMLRCWQHHVYQFQVNVIEVVHKTRVRTLTGACWCHWTKVMWTQRRERARETREARERSSQSQVLCAWRDVASSRRERREIEQDREETWTQVRAWLSEL